VGEWREKKKENLLTNLIFSWRGGDYHYFMYLFISLPNLSDDDKRTTGTTAWVSKHLYKFGNLSSLTP
jgi:hypothetical protein